MSLQRVQILHAKKERLTEGGSSAAKTFEWRLKDLYWALMGQTGDNRRGQILVIFNLASCLYKLTFLGVLLLRPEQFLCSQPKVSGSNNIVSTAGHDMPY